MPLYDDIECDVVPKVVPIVPPPTKTEKKDEEESEEPSKKKMNLSFLKTQLESKKANLQNRTANTFVPSAVINLNASSSTATNVAAKPKSLLNLKPRKAIPFPVDSASTFTIVPKALKEEKVFLFGEITVVDEYNPTAPTDYGTYKPKRDAQLVKEKIAKEVAERLLQQHTEEEEKRKAGAAIAPPQNLIQEDNTPASTGIFDIFFSIFFEEVFDLPPQFDKKSTSRGLSVAASIMSKLGYKHGQGLGREQQGMSTALRVDKTGKNGYIQNYDDL